METPSFIANTLLAEEFPNIDTQTTLVLVIQNTNGSILNNETRDFSYEFNNTIITSNHSNIVTGINGYYFLIEAGIEDAAEGYISESNTTTIIDINLNSTSDEEINNLVAFIHETVDSLQPDDYLILLTGSHVLFEDMRLASETDIITMDAIVLPIALIVLALVLKSFKLMIIPIISVAFSIAS